jgi:hypothetical protein
MEWHFGTFVPRENAAFEAADAAINLTAWSLDKVSS